MNVEFATYSVIAFLSPNFFVTPHTLSTCKRFWNSQIIILLKRSSCQLLLADGTPKKIVYREPRFVTPLDSSSSTAPPTTLPRQLSLDSSPSTPKILAQVARTQFTIVLTIVLTIVRPTNYRVSRAGLFTFGNANTFCSQEKRQLALGEDTQSFYSGDSPESFEDDASISSSADDPDNTSTDSSVEVVISLAATTDILWQCYRCPHEGKSHGRVEEHYLRAHEEIKLYQCETHAHSFLALHELRRHMIGILHDKELINVQWADGDRRKVTSIACILCSTTVEGASEYLEHCRRKHWKVKYRCLRCKLRFASRTDIRNHRNHHIQDDPEQEQNRLGILLNHCYVAKIAKALEALQESPTREIIAEWILDNDPPPPEHRRRCRAAVFATLREKFDKTEEGHWIATTKSATRSQIGRLVAIAFYERNFQHSSEEQIYELIKGDYPGQSKHCVIDTIRGHLTYTQYRYGADKKKKDPNDPITTWHIRRGLKGEVEFQAIAALSGQTVFADPGLTKPQLVVEALGYGPKNDVELYRWIARRYPFHIGAKKAILETAIKLKLPKARGRYYLRDSDVIQLKGKRKGALPISSLHHAAKRMRVNVNGNGNDTSLFQCISKLTPESDTMQRCHTLSPRSGSPPNADIRGYPKRNDPVKGGHEEDDPNLLQNDIGTPIKPGEQAEDMYRRLALLYRGSNFYRKGGEGLKEIANQGVSKWFLDELVYGLHVEEGQASERKELGLGWAWIAHISGDILSNIHTVLFTKPLFKILPPPPSSYEGKDAKSLFAAKGCCFSCLINHEPASACQLSARLWRPYPSPHFKYDCNELFLILLGEHASSSTLSKSIVHRWLRQHRPSATERERSTYIEQFCDTVGEDENGDDILALKSRFTLQAEESGSAFPNRTSPSSEPAPQDLIQPPSSNANPDTDVYGDDIIPKYTFVSGSMSPEDSIDEVRVNSAVARPSSVHNKHRAIKTLEARPDTALTSRLAFVTNGTTVPSPHGYKNPVHASSAEPAHQARIPGAISNFLDDGNIGQTHTWGGLRIEGARMHYPETLEWTWMIQNAGHSSIAKAKRFTILHLQRISIYYGKLGMGIQKIKDTTITNADLARTIYPLALANKQAGLRADKGLGWQIIEYISRAILRNIETARFGCSIFNPKWGDTADAAVCPEIDCERFVKIDAETLFPVGTGCIICLKVDHLSDNCPNEQSEVEYNFDELISMALSEEDSSNLQLPRATIRQWIGLYRSEKDLETMIDDALAKRLDQVRNDLLDSGDQDESLITEQLVNCYPALRFTKGEAWHNERMIRRYFVEKFTIIDIQGDGDGVFRIRVGNEDEAVLALCLDGTKLLPKDRYPFRLERD
ncbi:uncharacterized protein BP5553_09763 [Venustampulla echinocandica]|uniref:C2H2-type domain-containing protein n=1 Tax=Venustampulla echinocandica TaxID=2656787 RepID=A0A370TBX6_9HELO|nr:uncharacterized protein BP5553_09763 [Venustampulla echinocandica]RDL31554.1 hypothetical protein BP5553_09763 [Venustampulla echinocandica]